VVSLAQQFGPGRCRSAAQCYELTRDVQDAIRLMISELRRPDLLDTDRASPWAA
jgi:hypothetical protein